MKTQFFSPTKRFPKKKEKKRVFTTEEKLALVQDLCDGTSTAKKLSERFGYAPQYYRNLKDKYIRNGSLKSGRGRRSLLSEEDLDELDDKFDEKKLAIENDDFEGIVNTLADRRRTMSHPGDKKAIWTKGGKKKTVSRRTIGRIKKKLDLHDGNAETWTDARYKACCDKRNAVAFAVACSIMVPSSHRALIVNADGTSVNVGAILNQKKRVVYQGKRGKRKGLKTLENHKKKGGMGYFIKYYQIISAAPAIAEPIFVVADENMKKGDIDWYECGALSTSNDPLAKGYIVFCNTRCANEQFYAKVITDVIVPFVWRLRKKYNIDESVPAFWTEDGEDLQLKPLKQDSIIVSLTENRIEAGKSCQSSTEIQQPADAGDGFKCVKTDVRCMNDVDIREDPALDNAMREIIKQHQAKVQKQLSSVHKNALIKGVRKLRQAIADSITPHIVIQSFVKAGMYDPSAKPPGVNIETILGNCEDAFTIDEVSLFWQHLPELQKRMKAQGELFEKDFELLHLGLVEGGHENIDALQVNRRRFIFLLNANFISREKEKKEAEKKEEEEKEKRKEEKKKKKEAKEKAEKQYEEDVATGRVQPKKQRKKKDT